MLVGSGKHFFTRTICGHKRRLSSRIRLDLKINIANTVNVCAVLIGITPSDPGVVLFQPLDIGIKFSSVIPCIKNLSHFIAFRYSALFPVPVYHINSYKCNSS